MARKRVNLQWIANDSTRRATLKKRSSSLMKKVGEMSTLCGVKVAVVVYGDDDAMPAEVYPSVPEAMHVLYNYKAMPDHLENLKKVLSLEEYLRGRVSKLQDQMTRSDREKREEETLHLLHATMAGHGPGLANLTVDKLVNLNKLVEMKIKNIEERFGQLLIGQVPFQQPQLSPQEQPTLPPASQLQAPAYTEMPNMLAPEEEPQPQIYTQMPTLEPVEEQQSQQQDWLVDYFPWNGEEVGPVVYSNMMGTSNDGAGPSNIGGDTMQQYNMEGSGFPAWSPGTFPGMEYGGYVDYSYEA